MIGDVVVHLIRSARHIVILDVYLETYCLQGENETGQIKVFHRYSAN